MIHSLYELARNPVVQQRLIVEVDKLGGRIPEFEDLKQLPYTEAVFQVSYFLCLRLQAS